MTHRLGFCIASFVALTSSAFGCGAANEKPVEFARQDDPSEHANRQGGQPNNPLLIAEDSPNELNVDPGEELSRDAAGDLGLNTSVAPLRSAKNLVLSEIANWKLKDLVPFQAFPVVPPALVGIIWSAGRQPWGSGYEHGAMPSSSKDRIEYKFGVNGSSPYAVYFVSSGQGYNFLSNWSVPIPRAANGGGTYVQYNAAMFNAKTPNNWGLSRLAHIVEVDVNDKQGGTGIHFVVTNARVVDGTSAFPPRADDVLIGLRARFNTYLATQEDTMRAKLTKAVNAQPKTLHFGLQTIGPVGVFPTWNTARGAMEVVFTRQTTQTGQGTARRSVNRCPPCPPGAPCAACDDRLFARPQSVEVSAQTAVRYVVDKSGEVIAETRYLPIAPQTLEQAGGE